MKRLIYLIPFVAVYLMVAFYNWNINAGEWSKISRYAVIVISSTATCLMPFAINFTKNIIGD